MVQTLKSLPANAGDQGSIPGSGRSPGGGNGNHSSILAWRIPWRGTWCATFHEVAKSRTWLNSIHTHINKYKAAKNSSRTVTLLRLSKSLDN